MNLNKCVKLESTNEMVTISPDEFVGIVKVDNKIYHIGNKFGVNSGFVIRNGLVGKKVKIVRYGENTDEKAKELYPYFASVIPPLE